MSTIKANNLQIGQSATATQNFVLSVPASPDGTIKLSRGNQGATTADVVNVDASGNVGIGTSSPAGRLDVFGSGGWSSNNFGKDLIVRSGGNPTIGLLDSTGNNPIALTNNAGAFRIAAMPALSNSTTNPVDRLFINADGTINTNDNPITNCPTTAKAWVCFNSGAFPSVLRQYNVSSFAYLANGNYQINFTNNISSANYAVVATIQYANANGYSIGCYAVGKTSSYCIIQTYNNVGQWAGSSTISLMVFDL